MSLTLLFRIKLQRERVTGVLQSLDELARLSLDEPGCLSYDFYLSAGSVGQVVVLQTWRSREDYERHDARSYVGDIFRRHEDALLAPIERITLSGMSESAVL